MADEVNISAEDILDRKILLLDGGLGTTLEDEHNVKFTSAETPLWSSHLLLSSAETLLQVQTDFARAGADVILTATYQASFDGMARTPALSHWKHDTKSPPAEAKALLTSAVSISKKAIEQSGRPGVVALSLGAYGATLIPSQEYTGDYGEMQTKFLFEFHQARLNSFIEDDKAWKNIDIVAFETIPRLDEIIEVRRVMQSVEGLEHAFRLDDDRYRHRKGPKPYWISCVFPNDEDRLPDGSSVEDVAKAILSQDMPLPYAVGINCTKVHRIPRLVSRFEQVATELGLLLPRLVIYPDGAGGLIYDTAAQKWVGNGLKEAPWDEQVFDIVHEIAGRGKWTGILVGGCCKTNPEQIAKLRKRLDDWSVVRS